MLKVTTGLALGLGLLLAGATSHAADYGEAPSLAEKVQAGELPPVEERLPETPLIIQPYGETGEYGGTLRRASALLFPFMFVNMTREPLINFSYPMAGDGPPEPNLAESWSFNDEGTELTLNIRRGIKWSDGHPFTTDDIMFYWYDVMLDEQTSVPVHPALFAASGVVPELQQIDEHTIKLVYPFPFFYAEQALASVWDVFAWPKHHLSKDHPRYNSEATYEDFNKWAPWWSGRHRVTLAAWMMEDVSDDSLLVPLVRNPYYWKVDSEGNQLPYIDRVENVIVPDRQAVALGIIAGEFHYDGLWTGAQHLSLFLQEQEQRDLTIGWFLNNPGMAIHFNYDTEDESIRDILRDVDFRRAFSLAINRQAISRQSFFDLMEPSGWTFSPNSPYYDEEVGKLYSDYDVEEANRILDEAGYSERNADGIRLAPDGTPLSFVLDVSQHDLYGPIVEYISDNIKGDIGVEVVVNMQQQDLIFERRSTPVWQLHVWDIYGPERPLSQIEDWVPVDCGLPFWHQNACNEPFSAEYKEFSDIVLSARGLRFDEQVEVMKEANRIQAENVFNVHLGYYRRPYYYTNRLGNMIDETTRDLATGILESPIRPEQLYFKAE